MKKTNKLYKLIHKKEILKEIKTELEKINNIPPSLQNPDTENPRVLLGYSHCEICDKMMRYYYEVNPGEKIHKICPECNNKIVYLKEEELRFEKRIR